MIDAIGIVGDDGELCLVDWKTSNRLYPEYLCQISAYKELWNENVGKGTLPESLDRPLTGPFLLCRFDKEFADFAEQQYVELGSAWERFVHLRECYEIDKELKRRC
jgi:hypothetical protein